MRANRPRPVPAPCDGFQATLGDAESWRGWVIPWINWMAISAVAVFAAFMAVLAVFVGDWDDPAPPPRVGVWVIGGFAASVTVWIAWRVRLRSLRIAAAAALPLQAWFWYTLIEAAYASGAIGD
ncbi:MAG: hypothetical protein OXI97_12410 [Acidimicrobiaceae bacterium]|nr:hypothetical protein [Acidimicrobiaceae bacterium]